MKRLSLILIVLSLALAQRVHAQYYSVNYDARTAVSYTHLTLPTIA
mgnify:CR=1 FL=1